MIHISTPEQFDELVEATKNNGKPFVVDCYTSWCKPCKRIAPHYETFVNEFDGVFAKMDMDDEDLSDTARDEGMRKMPYFMVYKEGQQVGALQHSDKTLVKAFLKEHIPFTGQEEAEEEINNPATATHTSNANNQEEIKEYIAQKFTELLNQTNTVLNRNFTPQEVLQMIQDNVNTQSIAKPAAKPKVDILEIETPEQFDDLINNTTNGQTLVVDCHAPWCKPCKRSAPHVKEFATEFNATFAKLNIDDDDLQDSARSKGLTKIPFFMIFQNGTQIEETLQHSQKDIIREYLLRYVSLNGKDGVNQNITSEEAGTVKQVENVAVAEDVLDDDAFNFDMDF